jgi:hypothetical protein
MDHAKKCGLPFPHDLIEFRVVVVSSKLAAILEWTIIWNRFNRQ